ncbi:hypothetical protein DV737_g5355, partial [Chaetothyriales sp. CBS 132003]
MLSRYADVHQRPQGPGDARPTGLQIVQDEQLEGKWTDKAVWITGCSSSLGVETARAMAATGARLYLTARDLAEAREALGPLAECERVQLVELDLDSLDSVQECAERFLASADPKLNVLICNAGVTSCPEGRTADGFETQFGTNHLAHFLLINCLTEALIKSSTRKFASRVIIVSAAAHRWGSVHFDNLNLENGAYTPDAAYSQSKTANVWTANELERWYGEMGVLHAWSVQPGVMATDLSKMAAAMAAHAQLAKTLKSAEQAAATTTWAATAAALEGSGGKYLEDCQIIGAWDESVGMWAPGYAAHAYSPEDEAKLWDVSLKLTGLA